MPTRILRDGILTSDAVNALSLGGEVFYRRLMSLVDDYGRYEARPTILLTRLYPLQLDRVKAADIERWLQECTELNLVLIYAAAGKPYLQLLNFNQRVQSRSKWPEPPAHIPSNVLRETRDSPESAVTHRDPPERTAIDVVVVGVVDVVEKREAPPPERDDVLRTFPTDWEPGTESLAMLQMRGIPPPTPETVAGFVGHMLGRPIEPRRIPGEFLKWTARQRGFDKTTAKHGASQVDDVLRRFVEGS